MEREALIHKNILESMSDGVMAISFDGKILSVNPAAERILERSADELTGHPFALSFFEYEENDDFNQTVLNAVENPGETLRAVVPYFTGQKTKQLGVASSFLQNEEEKIGVTLVFSDISELVELTLKNEKLNNTFGRYLSDEIVKQLMGSPDGLAIGGKKKEIAVMMSDLRGFTAMSEMMSAEDLVAMLNHYLGEMTECIEGAGGTVIEFIGDGILAIFGAPVESENSAEDAVVAALNMQLRMPEINAWNSARNYPELEMGIGLNYGDMIVGNIGSEKRTKYGVIGSNVNLAGRVESYTVGRQILISPYVKEKLRAEAVIAEETEVFPKGVEGGLVISRITGLGAPYELYLSENDELPWQELDAPEDVEFIVLSGKHAEGHSVRGSLISQREKEYLLETETELSRFDNIKLFLQDSEVYAKVTGKEKNGYCITVTAELKSEAPGESGLEK